MNFKQAFHNNYKNALLLGLRYILLIFIGIFQVYLFTHYVEKEVYGQFQYFVTILAMLSLFSLPGSNLAFTKMGALKDERFHVSILKVRVLTSCFASLILLLFAGYFYKINFSMSLAYISAAVMFPFLYSLDSYLHILNGREQFNAKTAFEILKKFLIFVTLLTLIYFDLMNNIFILVVSIFMSEIICHVAGELYTIKTLPPQTDKGCDHNFYRKFTKNMTFISFLGVIEGRIDRLIVGTFLGFSNLAIFHVGKVVLEQVKAIWVIISTLLLPKIFKKSTADSYKLTFFTFPVIWTFFGVLIAFLLYFLNDIILLWFGANYMESVPLARLMLYSSFFSIPHTVFVTYMSTQNLLVEISKIKIATIVVYSIFLAALTSKYGVYGVVYAWIIKTVFGSLLSTIVFIRLRKRLNC
ncbi:MAG: hypothetical protein KC646_07125 [Candidatus Cloacimonetes bacterium]|nr:hypothetical protein [Candidatus Cloacimonadota bacterium]